MDEVQNKYIFIEWALSQEMSATFHFIGLALISKSIISWLKKYVYK